MSSSRLQAQIGAPAPAAGAPPLFTGPLDVIARTVNPKPNATPSPSPSPSPSPHLNQVIARTVRAEGVAGLFRGNLSTLAREVLGNMAWF